MNLKRESKTEWEMVTVCGERNQSETITATDEGLEIGYCGTIPWSEIDEARAAPIADDNAEKKCEQFLCEMLNLPRFKEAMLSGWTREDMDTISERVEKIS